MTKNAPASFSRKPYEVVLDESRGGGVDSHFLKDTDEVVSAPPWLKGRTWWKAALERESKLPRKLFSEFSSCFMFLSPFLFIIIYFF